MSLVAAAVCPHPPLLVPEVASGAAPELDSLRIACVAAVETLRTARPDLLVVVGRGPETRYYASGSRGSLAGFGVPAELRLGAGEGEGDAMLPLSLTVGAWLLREAEYDGAVVGLAVDGRDTSAGLDLAVKHDRLAMLVMGDGSARRTPKAPGAFDDRAEPFDRAVASALANADVDAVLSLDETLADELMVAGLPAWQVLARAAGDVGPWRGEVTYDDAPYGVGYLVASWQR